MILNFSFCCAVYYEIRLLIELFLVLRTDEHIGNEVCLPCNLHDETYFHSGVLVCTAETVNYEKSLA